MARSRYRRVRTPEGAKRYGAPIGSIIRVDRDLPRKGTSSKDHPSKDTGEDDGPEAGGSTPPPPKDPPAAPPVGPDDDDDGTDDVDPEDALDELLDKSGGVLAPETRPGAEGEAREPRHMDRIDGEEWASGVWNYTPDNHPFSDDEYRAIETYTDTGFAEWNADLRDGLRETRYVEQIADLDAAIERAPAVPEPVVVSRTVADVAFARHTEDVVAGLDEDEIERLSALSDAEQDRAVRRLIGEHLVGSEVDEAGFMSTSVQADGLDDAPGYVLRLTVPTGTRGVYVSNPDGPISAAMRQENELVLGRGVRYRIDRAEASDDGVVELHATVVEQNTVPVNQLIAPTTTAPAYRGVIDDPVVELYAERDQAVADGLAGDVAQIDEELRQLPKSARERAQLIRANVDTLQRVAKARKADPEQAMEIASEGLRRFVQDRDVAVTVSSRALEGVLEDGRFRTQHEPGAVLSTMATRDPQLRSDRENAWFGPHSDHPVYGYIRDRSDTPSGADTYGERHGDDYPDPVTVVMRDAVRSRTTVSVGDSLARFRQVFPGPMDDPGPFSGNPSRVVTNNITDTDGYVRYLEGGIGDEGDRDGFYREEYVEAQIHGGVQVSDIAQVIFHGEPNPAILARLDEMGIAYRRRGEEHPLTPAQRAAIEAFGGTVPEGLTRADYERMFGERE